MKQNSNSDLKTKPTLEILDPSTAPVLNVKSNTQPEI